MATFKQDSNTIRPLQIIPAIDLLNGQVVRLYQGNYDQVTVYCQDPAKQAKQFQQAGAEILHIVDLSAARTGKRQDTGNSQAITAILKALGKTMKVELGGGIRNLDSLKECFDLGVDRCVLGTAAVKDPKFLEKSLGIYGPEKIIVGVDARNQTVQLSGWEEESFINVRALLKDLENKGVCNVIFTDISRDGTLSGPGKALYNYIEDCNLDFILSGGLSCLEDLKEILSTRHLRLVGVISGRAIYEKRLDIGQAVQMCKA